MLIANKKNSINENWEGRTEFTNPFYFAFEKFVNYEIFEKIIFDFNSKNFKDRSKAFEQGISWLLTLLGIPTIMLDEYQNIRKDSKMISTDIIGKINKNLLIIVHVTTGLPKQSDFDREKEYRENLLSLIKNDNLKIKSVYVTSKEPTESGDSANANDILLIGFSSLNLILDHLKKGELSEARNIITGESDFEHGL